jgi:hypothetical protein
LDFAKHHGDTARREAAQRWCSLVTPVIKAAFTQQAFYGGSECLQVFGGHGYVREWGIEQNVRDARVAMIYEGTNEIQAIDLLVRKVLADGGSAFSVWLADLASEMPKDHPEASRLLARLTMLKTTTSGLAEAVARDNALAYWVADDYLRAVALVLLDWAWAKIETTVDAGQPRWQAPAQALQRWVMPELAMRLAIIENAIP